MPVEIPVDSHSGIRQDFEDREYDLDVQGAIDEVSGTLDQAAVLEGPSLSDGTARGLQGAKDYSFFR